MSAAVIGFALGGVLGAGLGFLAGLELEAKVWSSGLRFRLEVRGAKGPRFLEVVEVPERRRA